VFQKILKKDSDAARTLDEMIDEKDRSYDERMLKRVLKLKDQEKG